MQKILNIFIVLTLVALPMLSAVASAPHCNMEPDSMVMVDAQQNTMTAEHDCCEKPVTLNCSHCGECDCDNTQSGVSFLNPASTQLSLSSLNLFEPVSYAVQIPAINSSLYRPPITNL